MITIEAKGHKIELFDGIEKMPVVRYNKYTKYRVLSSGVGNTIGDIIAKLSSLQSMIGKEGCEKKMNSEILALKQTFHFCTANVDPATLAFSCLVASVDGEECTDMTDEGFEAVRKRISQWLTREDVTIALSGIKKK